MANYIVTTKELTEIADAIREKTGGSETYKFNELAEGIENIPSSGGSGKSSTLTIYKNLTESFIDLDNDERFEHTNNLGAWSTKDLFQHDGHNMYSAPAIDNNQTSMEYMKNLTNKTMLLKAYYQSSTEGSSYDYGYIDAENTRVSNTFGGSDSGETEIFSLSPNTTLIFYYRKDRGTAGGKDNVGIALYELKEVN